MQKRTEQTQAAYDRAREEGDTIIATDEQGHQYFQWYDRAAIRDYMHWVIIHNRFPYDAMFTEHHLLIPKKRIAFLRDAAQEVRDEYYEIKKNLDQEEVYESIIENFSNSRSVGGHYHIHLVNWLD